MEHQLCTGLTPLLVLSTVQRDDFEGVELTMGTSGFMHDNDNGYVGGLLDTAGFTYPTGSDGVDGRADTIDLVMGTQFADDKGHATFYTTWEKVLLYCRDLVTTPLAH